jgi:DNA-binding NarL/FixJ family response regulator
MTAAKSEPQMLGVLLIGFNPVVREGLKAILSKDPGIVIIGDALDEHQALKHIKESRNHGKSVNVVLTESRNDKVDGVQITRLIKDEFPEISVIVLTENPNDTFVIDAIHAGAGGYIFLEDMTKEVLLQSIHRVVEGGTQMKTALLHTAVENLIQNGRRTLAERTTEAAHLTEREVDVLRLMGNGDSNKIIAETLGITMDTTKKHVRNVIDKMQARSRTHAAIIAAQAGIVGKAITPIMKTSSETAPITGG